MKSSLLRLSPNDKSATPKCTGTHGPDTLQERIEAFLDSSTSLLADLQAEDFERHRQALIAAKLQQCHSLLDESDRHWEQIQTRRYNCISKTCMAAH